MPTKSMSPFAASTIPPLSRPAITHGSKIVCPGFVSRITCQLTDRSDPTVLPESPLFRIRVFRLGRVFRESFKESVHRLTGLRHDAHVSPFLVGHTLSNCTKFFRH